MMETPFLPFTKNYCNLQFLQLYLLVFIFLVVLLLCEYASCFLYRNIYNDCATHNYAIFFNFVPFPFNLVF